MSAAKGPRRPAITATVIDALRAVENLVKDAAAMERENGAKNAAARIARAGDFIARLVEWHDAKNGRTP